MEWEERSKPSYKFVDWEELKEGHNPDDNIVVKLHEWVEGQLADVIYKDDGSIKAFILKVDGEEKDIWVWSNMKLINQMGFGDDDYDEVQIGQWIRISYFGKYKTKSGGQGYDVRVAVAKDMPKKGK